MKKYTLLAILIPSLFLTACANHKKETVKPKIMNSSLVSMAAQQENNFYKKYTKVLPDIYLTKEPLQPEVIKNGRYTFVTSNPVDGQKYLLNQFVSMNIKNKKKFYSVQNGIQHILMNTGYTLCSVPGQKSVSYLFSRQLPLIHYKINKMHLSEALQMLAGPSFDLVVDEAKREVCFKNRVKNTVLQQPVKKDK